MNRTSLILSGIVATLIGFIIGQGVDYPLLPGLRQANALDRHTVNRLHQELDINDGPLIAGSERLAKIAELATPSVVHIQSEYESRYRGAVEETGSGVIIAHQDTNSYYVVTNRHVVAAADLENISIHLSDGRVIHPLKVWQDQHTDVAVMRISTTGLTPARWGNSDSVKIGNLVIALGSPFGLSQSMTLGIISAKGRRSLELGESNVLNQDFLQTDAAINPGNSGGPLIDMHGRIIGINTAIASNSGGNEGIGFSIPSNLVRTVVDQLLQYGQVRRAYLGVRLDSKFDQKTIKRLSLSRLRGARVVEVYPNTPASRVKLNVDDVILSFNGTEVQDESHLINMVSLTPIGKKVPMVVYRGGRQITLYVVLGNRSELQKK